MIFQFFVEVVHILTKLFCNVAVVLLGHIEVLKVIRSCCQSAQLAQEAKQLMAQVQFLETIVMVR